MINLINSYFYCFFLFIICWPFSAIFSSCFFYSFIYFFTHKINFFLNLFLFYALKQAGYFSDTIISLSYRVGLSLRDDRYDDCFDFTRSMDIRDDRYDDCFDFTRSMDINVLLFFIDFFSNLFGFAINFNLKPFLISCSRLED